MLVSTRSRLRLVALLVYIVEEDSFHLGSAISEAVLFVLLNRVVTKRVSQLVLARRRQLTTFLRRRVVLEPLCSVVERPSSARICVLVKLRSPVVRHVLVETSDVRESLGPVEGVVLLGSRPVYSCQSHRHVL